MTSPTTTFAPCLKVPWTEDEDRVLRALVDEHGPHSWSKLAGLLNMWFGRSSNEPGRIGKQARERFHNHLDPNLKTDWWTLEEDEAIVNAYKTFGSKWSKMATLESLSGRTANAIKNHFNSSLKRLVESGEPLRPSIGPKTGKSHVQFKMRHRSSSDPTNVSSSTLQRVHEKLSARNVISSCSSECDPSYVPSIQISEETPLDLDEPTTSFEPSFSCVSKIFSSPVPRRCYTHFRSESNTSASDGVFPQLSPSVAFPSAVARAPLFLNHSIEDVSLRMDTDAFSCETPCSYSSCSSSTSFELPSFSPDEYDVNELSFVEHHCPLSPSCELYQLARAASPGTFDILDSCDCASRALYDDSNLSLETVSLLPDEDDCERMYPMDASPLASAALKRASLFLEEDIFSFPSYTDSGTLPMEIDSPLCSDISSV